MSKFDQWGIVEIMGHARVAGRITEETIAGTALLRVDVPQKIEGEADFRTEYVGGGSIYRMHVTTEEVARQVAESYQVARPSYAFGLRLQSPAIEAPRQPAAPGYDTDEEHRDDPDDYSDGRF